MINLRTGKKKVYKTKGWFIFVGQNKSSAYFVSSSFNTKIAGYKIKSKNSVISISEKGVNYEIDNNSYGGRYLWNDRALLRRKWIYYSKDTVNEYKFFNPFISVRCLTHEDNSGMPKPIGSDFITLATGVFSIGGIEPFDAEENSYTNGDTTYLIFKGSLIYRATQTSFEKLFDFQDYKIYDWIREFKIDGKYLIFKTQGGIGQGFGFDSVQRDTLFTANGLRVFRFASGHNVLGIIDLETKKVFYPKIINRS